MKRKITWKDIRADFKFHHPKLHKQSDYWRPYSFATIELWMKDGRKFIYNYDTKQLTKL